MNVSKVPSFNTEEEAFDWMYVLVSASCFDNERFCFSDDPEAVQQYEQQRCDGCCGSFDTVIKVDGREATIGCNYSH